MTWAETARQLGASTAFALLLPAALSAQTPSQTPAPSKPGSRWEIEAHGGLSTIFAGSGGSAALPPAGAPIVTTSPIFPSWKTSSWFFGDGASMLNEATSQLGASPITPLDTALKSLGLSSSPGASLGLRVRLVLTRRLAVEVSVDRLVSSRNLTTAMKSSIEASRSSFESAFAGLFASGPFSGTTVKATAVTTGGTNGELALTGGVDLKLRDSETFTPYLTLGGGFVRPIGQLPSTQLQGHYQTLIAGTVPIDETDTVTIRYSTSPRLVGVVGGGVRRNMSETWGYRIDGRVFLSSGTDTLRLDANPSSKSGTPAGYIETLTYPNIQFSNNTSTGRASTLSGDPTSGFTAFSGGLAARVLITAGIFVRF